MKRLIQILAALSIALTARAELVHVFEQTSVGGATNQLSDTVLETTVTYTTQAAPEISGFIFTHWSISTAQEFTNRDRWGRAFDSAPYTLYEETTLTANYLPATQDSDADGMADGYELYWYGDLAKSAQSDTDNDGFTFEEEIALGTNPLFADEYAQGGIEYADSELILYNPLCYQPYIVRSDPEGALFESSTNWVRPGTSVSSPSYDHASSIFAYWTLNGAQRRDRWGRALDAISFTMPSNAVELVAHTSTDDLTREALYWYGSSTITAQSDSDGDGFTFEEEIALGTNPLFADEYAQGGIEYADSELLLYNPYDIQPYIVRSEPEGVLFATATNWMRGGTAVSSPVCDHTSTAFAYWTLNDTQQRDRWGRALDSVTFAMPSEAVELVAVTVEDLQDRQSLYWYGCPAESAPADSDNDGFTFEEELALGTNPLFADDYPPGGIEYADSELLEANLQPYEQLTRGLVGGEAVELFRSNFEQNDGAMNFGTNAAVAVVDANGDGLEDLLIAGTSPDGGTQTTLLLNHGATGSPDFTIAENPWAALNAALAAGGTIAGGLGPNGANGVYLSGEPIRFFDFATGTFFDTALSGVPAWHDGVLYALDTVAGTVSTTNGVLTLDTRIIRGVSLTVADADNDGLPDLLVTDEDGRVWFYKGIGDQGNIQPFNISTFQLRHKVWGGAFGGFSEGLKIAATDWNADGNLDAIGATAGGTLVLLRDPRVGVPANLRIAAGMTSVLLEWDPNTQSRVRGYRVYRGDSQAGDFTQITEPWTPLPSYRDYPEILQDWWYRVTSIGRFYTSGNSAPTFVESSPTEALVAHLGGIELFVRDANGATGQEVEIVVAINNSLGVAAKDLSLTLEYDAALLEPRRVLPSGLTEAVAFTENAANGAWTVSATSGTVDPGAGTLFTFVFYVKPQHVADETTLSITAAAAKSVSGQSATIPLPVSGTLSIFDTDPPVRPNVSVETCVREVIERETVELPVVLVTDRALDASALLVSGGYDDTFLAPGASGNIEAANGRWIVSGLAGTIPVGTNTVATLVFTALDIAFDMRTALPVTNVAAVSTAGVATSATPPDPFVVTIRNNPAFDPVHATFLPGTASAKIGTEATLPVSVQIDAALDGAAWTVSGAYDASLIDVLGAVSLASGVTNSCTVADGAFTVRGTGGTLEAAADAQPLFALRVRPKVQYATRTTKVIFETAAATAADGRVVETVMGAGGDVAIRFASDTDAPDVSLGAWAGEVIERETVSVPVRVTTTEALDREQFALEGTWDTARLELVRIEAADGYSASSPSNGAWRIEGTAGIVPVGTAALGTLVFRAKEVATDAATLVHATGGTAVSTEGLSGTVPATSWSILVKNNIAYDPAHAIFLPGSAATKVGTATTLPISVQIDAPLDGAQWSIQGIFDTTLLDVTVATGADGLSVTFSKSGGTFTVRGTGGTLAAASGSQALFTLTMTPKVQYATRLASIAFSNPTAKTTDGRTFEASVSNSGSIALRFADSSDPPVVSFRSGALEVMERERVSVPIVFITTDTIDVSTIRISGTYPGQRLGFVRATAGDAGCSVTAGNGSWTLSGTTGFLLPNTATTLATLVFDALDVTEDTITLVEVASASAKSAEGLDAVVRQASPIVVTIRNNPAFDPVHATFLPGTVSAKIGTDAALPVSVQIDAPLNGVAWMVSGTYDVSLIDILGATAVATGMSVECTATNGAFTVRGTGGTLAAKTAAQRLFSFTVRPVEQYATRQTTVAITNATATATDGRVFETAIGAGGAVGIHFSDTGTPPTITYPATSAEGYERREITVPMRLTTSQALNRGQLAVEGSWDVERLDLIRVEATSGFSGESPASGGWRISGTDGVVPAGTATLGALVFRAKDVTTDTQTQVTVNGGTAVSTEGIAAPLVPSASFGVLVKNDPAFDPIHATFAIGSATAEIESVASVKVSATFEQPINGATLVAKIKYNTSLLTVTDVSPHVNGFTLSWSAAGGVLTVTGKGGTIPVPSSKLDLFTVSFRLAKQQTSHTAPLSFAATPVAKSTDGRTYIIDSATGGSVAITWTEKPRYFKGDVDGDGDLDGDDVRMMAKIIQQGSKPTASELKAGDFNGDGKITTADYTLLKQYFKELGISNR